MGALLSIPLLGSVGGLASTIGLSCLSGLAFFCTSRAASAFCKSCNCNSSVATRVGFSLIFLLNSLFAWIMLTPFMIKKLEHLSYDYIKMSCKEGQCYGVLAVHRICFALALFHVLLACLLIGVESTRAKRAAIQNGWWGPKVLAWLALIVVSFFIPNGFFMFYSRYIALIGSTIFILVGLVLLVDFAHTWSEQCLDNWEESESTLWKVILIGSTLSMYAGTIAMTGIDYAFFGISGCGLNQFFITFNLLLCVLVTGLSIHPRVQDANPRSGLAQSGMVAIYCTYLVTSAVANHDDEEGSGRCNPLTARAAGARTSMVIVGALFTFLAVAYSTSRAATQSRALVGKKRATENAGGPIRLDGGELGAVGSTETVTSQPTKKDTLRVQALMAAVEAGSIPASALDEDDDDEDDEGAPGADDRDDEKAGTRYNYSWFHVIFALATMYVAMLLTNWNVVISATSPADHTDPISDHNDYADPVRIGRTHVAMWMRIVSGWVCLMLYAWSLVAPVLFPERFMD